MQLKEAIQNRASVRQFLQEQVSVDHLREMVRLAGLAPSVNNSQPWRYIAITNRPLLQRMAVMVHEKVKGTLLESDDESVRKAKSQVEWFSTFFADAPAVIAVAARPYAAVADAALPEPSLNHDDLNAIRGHPDIQSIGASIENLMLAAVDLGYGTCWLSGPLVAREELEAALGINAPERLAAMVAVGKPAAAPHQKEKRPVEEILEIRP